MYALTGQYTRQQCSLIMQSAVASKLLFNLSKGHAAPNNWLHIKGPIEGHS